MNIWMFNSWKWTVSPVLGRNCSRTKQNSKTCWSENSSEILLNDRIRCHISSLWSLDVRASPASRQVWFLWILWIMQNWETQWLFKYITLLHFKEFITRYLSTYLLSWDIWLAWTEPSQLMPPLFYYRQFRLCFASEVLCLNTSFYEFASETIFPVPTRQSWQFCLSNVCSLFKVTEKWTLWYICIQGGHLKW